MLHIGCHINRFFCAGLRAEEWCGSNFIYTPGHNYSFIKFNRFNKNIRVRIHFVRMKLITAHAHTMRRISDLIGFTYLIVFLVFMRRVDLYIQLYVLHVFSYCSRKFLPSNKKIGFSLHMNVGNTHTRAFYLLTTSNALSLLRTQQQIFARDAHRFWYWEKLTLLSDRNNV